MGLPGEGPGVPARCLFGGWESWLPLAWGWAGLEALWLEASLPPVLPPCWGWRGGQDQAPLTPGAGAGEEPPAAGWGCADMPGTSRRLACAIRTEIVR